MDQEQQRDPAEVEAPGPWEETEPRPDERMSIEVRKWTTERSLFEDYQQWVIEEPYAERSQPEWFGIVTTHVPRDLPVGIYAFRLFSPSTLIAAGEFAWDGRVATRREGASAP